jgi:hypothetical protein
MSAGPSTDPTSSCLAAEADGTPCPEPGTISDPDGGGLVCWRHDPDRSDRFCWTEEDEVDWEDPEEDTP